jgi:hypothetical protein
MVPTSEPTTRSSRPRGQSSVEATNFPPSYAIGPTNDSARTWSTVGCAPSFLATAGEASTDFRTSPTRVTAHFGGSPVISPGTSAISKSPSPA